MSSLAVGLVCWVIIHLFITPYEAYWLWRFWKARNALIIKKRKPGLVVTASISLWIFFFFSFSCILMKFEINAISTENQIIFQGFNDFVNVPFLWGYFLIHIGRFWLMFYMINYNSSIVHNKWQSVIDPTIATTNWYSVNIYKWGSWKYIKKWLCAYFFIAYFFTNFWYILFATNLFQNIDTYFTFAAIGDIFFTIFCVSVPLILSAYFLCKIPSFNDEIGIRKELTTTTYVVISLLSLYLAVKIKSITTQLSSGTGFYHDTVTHISWYLYLTAMRSLLFMVALRHTRWLLVTFKEVINESHDHDPDPADHARKVSDLLHQKTYIRLEQQSHANENNIGIMARKEMRESLANCDLFDAFMIHLLNEYCGECLLSIIEFMQFKERLVDENEEIVFDIEEDTMFKLPPKLVKSRIVYGDDNENYELMAEALYNKYIRIGTEWEINIDYHNRNRYQDIFENNKIPQDKQELYVLFDKCIVQMTALILAAYARFKNGKKCQMIEQYSPPMTPKLSGVFKLSISNSKNKGSMDDFSQKQ